MGQPDGVSATRNRQAITLAESLVDLPEEKWDRAVRAACPDDPVLQKQVLSILQAAIGEEGIVAEELLERVLTSRKLESTELRRVVDALPAWFVVLGQTGRGGSAVVLKALDTRSSDYVAIKLFWNPHDPSAPRARREHRISVDLDHPGIMPILASGEAAGCTYLIMPFVEGGTLRDRIDADGPFPIDVATQVIAQAAEALACAHERGVIHRDVKPENFLMDGDRPVLTDFGIAREAQVDKNTFMTSHGHVVGTVSYLSPERAGGRKEDARSDLYSLGCVFYELLTGEPPFLGATAESIMNKHLTDVPGSPERLRAGVPPALVAIVGRLLAKAPVDRFPDAKTLVKALGAADLASGASWSTTTGRRTSRGTPWIAAAGLVFTAVAATLFLSNSSPPESDPNVVAIIPAFIESGGPAYKPLDYALHEEFSRWDEIETIDVPRVLEVVREEPPGVFPLAEAATFAKRVNAGRFVITRAEPREDSVRYSASIYGSDGSARGALNFGAITLHKDEVDRLAVANLADRLLFGPTWAGDGATGDAGTYSSQARRAFGSAMLAMADWELVAARSFLREAVAADPNFMAGHLATARVRHWLGDPQALWAESAQLAAESGVFRAGDSIEASALSLLASRRYAEACTEYDRLTESQPRSFASWYGRAECRRMDEAVEPDPTGPSGWRFRSSQTDAIRFFEGAFRQAPEAMAAFANRSFERLRARLAAHGAQVRRGVNTGDGPAFFVGYPMRLGDSLAYVPYPWDDTGGRTVLPNAASVEQAWVLQRASVRNLARRWVDRAPLDPRAMYGFAISLEMLGDPAAVDSIYRARTLESRDQHARALAATQAWLMIKHGIGRDSLLVVSARVLSDSLLATTQPGESQNPTLMASLAAVTGRAELASSYMAQSAYEQNDFPEQLERSSAAFTMAAAAGAESSRLADLEDDLLRLIDEMVVSEDAGTNRRMFVERGAMIAFPQHTSRLHTLGHPFQSPLARAQGAFLRGADSAFEAEAATYRRGLSQLPAARVSIEAVFPEFHLWLAAGDTAHALEIIRPSVANPGRIQPGVLRDDPVRALIFVRALEEVGNLLVRRGEAEGAAWLRDAHALTSDALAPITVH